jgi:hypothetical protein
MLRFIGFAAVLALVVLGLPAASTAGNHQTFTDVVGDDSGGLAPDITSVDVTSSDNGDVVWRISINEQNGTFYVGDSLELGVDSDLNANTGRREGTLGIDSASFITTKVVNGQGVIEYSYCNFGQGGNEFDCHPYNQGDASDTKTGANSHMVTFSNGTSNWFRVGFYVAGSYQDPASGTSGAVYSDFAPDTDPDQDGVAGSADKCPSYKGGPLDKNGDGCPPVLPTPGWRWTGGRVSGSYASFSQVIVTRAASGVTVTARFPGYTTRRRGTGPLPGISRRRFRVNSHVTIILTNRNYFGTYRMLRVTPGGGLATFATGCTPPGRTTFIPCPKL